MVVVAAVAVVKKFKFKLCFLGSLVHGHHTTQAHLNPSMHCYGRGIRSTMKPHEKTQKNPRAPKEAIH